MPRHCACNAHPGTPTPTTSDAPSTHRQAGRQHTTAPPTANQPSTSQPAPAIPQQPLQVPKRQPPHHPPRHRKPRRIKRRPHMASQHPHRRRPPKSLSSPNTPPKRTAQPPAPPTTATRSCRCCLANRRFLLVWLRGRRCRSDRSGRGRREPPRKGRCASLKPGLGRRPFKSIWWAALACLAMSASERCCL